MAGQDVGQLLDGKSNGIPIFKKTEFAVKKLISRPECFIYGRPLFHGKLEEEDRQIFFEAIKFGMNIINGLPLFLSQDKEFVEYAKKYEVVITDLVKLPPRDKLHAFTGRIQKIKTPVVAILGTDSELGTCLVAQKMIEAFKEEGLLAAFVATGPPGLLLGTKYGLAIDQLTSEFAAGEIEHAILEADEGQFYDLILIEGQAPLSHPSLTSTCAILKGALPDAIVVHHAPKRRYYSAHPDTSIKSLQAEIDLIEEFAGPYVMAVTINQENMSEKEVEQIIEDYEELFQIPVSDVSFQGCEKLLNQICQLFPDLQQFRNSSI